MKHLITPFVLIFVLSCGKKDVQSTEQDYYDNTPIDTVAIDSFGPGASPNVLKPKPIIIDSIKTKQKDSIK